jgi:hypothetical protein
MSADIERRGLQLLLALTGVAVLITLYNAFFIPGTLSYAPFTIQDDARQFLSWTARLDDASALPDDLLASYWHDVSPFLFRTLYGAANLIGLSPVVFSRLLPVPLLFLSAWLAWRVALRLSGGKPITAFVAAAFLVSFLIHEDSIASATPRAFSAPLFLLFLDGLQRERGAVMIPALALLGLLYPTTALVGVTMLGLSRIGIRPWKIDFSRRSWLLGGIAAVAVLVAILPFAGAESEWGPTLNVQQALDQPNLGTFDGRSSIVGRSGSVDYLCSARMGLLTEIVPCWSTSLAVVPNLLLMVPMLFLAWRALRRKSYRPGDEPGDLLHAWVIVAGIAWWLVATIVAFKLHLPSRYTQRTLAIFEFLAIGQLLGAQLERRLGVRRRSVLRHIPGLLLALFFTASFLTPLPGLQRPRDPDAVAQLAAMPAGTVIAGVSEDMDFYPALTGQSVLATIEHAIPYSTRYFDELQRRLGDTLIAVSTPDPAVLADYVRRYHVGVIALDAGYFEFHQLPASWTKVVPDPVRAGQEMLDAHHTVVQDRAAACILHRGLVFLLDANCLIAAPAPLATGAPPPI